MLGKNISSLKTFVQGWFLPSCAFVDSLGNCIKTEIFVMIDSEVSLNPKSYVKSFLYRERLRRLTHCTGDQRLHPGLCTAG